MGNSMVTPREGTLEVGDADGSLLNTVVIKQTDDTEAHNEVIDQGNIISDSVADAGSVAGNSRDAATLAAAATFQGVSEDVSHFGRVGVAIRSDNATDGTLTIEVSHDNSIWSGPTRTLSDTRFSQPVMWNIVEKYFRIKYVNGSTQATNLSIQVQYSNNADIQLAHPLSETLIEELGAQLVRAVLVGRTQGGKYVNVPVGSEGHLQMDIPLTAFGELQVAEKTPQVQIKFPNGLIAANTQILTNKSGSGVTTTNGLCSITVAGAAEAFSQIRSLDVIRLGSGQGMAARWSGSYTTGLADSSLWVGPGDDDEMLAFGFNGTSFGILHRQFGELEVRKITFTAGGDAGGGTFTLTMDGTAVTITVPSGSATIADICALVVAASADLFNAGRGWEVHTDDSISVEFISLVAENAGGTFSFADVDSGVTAGTFQQDTTILIGVAPTEVITAQASWNIDVMDGTGVSGMTLDPNKINSYNVDFQSGAGNLFLSVENPETGHFEPVHMMKHSNNRTDLSFRNPTFHLTAIAKTDAGFSGAAQTIKIGSMGGFIEGSEARFGTRESVGATQNTNGTNEVCVLVLHNENNFQGTRNKVVVYPDHLTLINEATKSVKFRVVANPTHIDSGVTLSSVNANESVMLSGSPGGTIQGGTEVLEFALSASSSKDVSILGLLGRLIPSDDVVVTVQKTTGGADGAVTVGLSWLERI